MKNIFYIAFLLTLLTPLSAERMQVLNFVNHSAGKKNVYYGEIIYETIVNRINVAPQRVAKESFEGRIQKEALLVGGKRLLDELYSLEEDGYYYLKGGLSEEERGALTELFARLSSGSGYTFVALDERLKKEASFEKVKAAAALKRVNYVVSGYYSATDEWLKIVFKVYDVVLGRYIVIYELNESQENSVFDIVNSGVNELFRQLAERREQGVELAPELSRRSRVEQSKFVGELHREFMVLFKFGMLYSPIAFGVRDVKNRAVLDIEHIYNKNIHHFAPTFDVEFYRSVDLHYFGGGCHVETPIFIQTNNFYSNALTRFYFAFAFRKQFFFKWGFDYYFIMYDKYSADKSMRVQAMLMTFGASFDFTYMPRRFPFYVEGGFTIYPSWFYSDEEIAENVAQRKSDSSGGDGPAPFQLKVGNDVISRANYIIPVAPRLAVGYFTKSGIGFYLSYSMTFLQTRYDDIKSYNTGPTTQFYYLGDETAIVNKITLGIMYRGVIK